MKLKLFLAMAVLALQAVAADYAAIRRDADTSQATVTSPGAECNRDAETFAEFIVKFTTDAAFAAERSKIAQIFALKSPADYRALVVTSGHEAGYVQMWKIIGPDRVKLVCGFAGAPADYGYIFTRKGGKWMLVDRVTEEF